MNFRDLIAPLYPTAPAPTAHRRVEPTPQSPQSQDFSKSKPSSNGDKKSENKQQTPSRAKQQGEEPAYIVYAKHTSKTNNQTQICLIEICGTRSNLDLMV